MGKDLLKIEMLEPRIAKKISHIIESNYDKEPLNLLANKVAQEVVKELSDKNSDFFKELYQIVTSIDSAKHEIAAIRPKELAEKDIPDATNALDIIIQTSQEAASEILSCGEKLMEIAEFVPETLQKRLMDIATKMFEASNFDDLNGQRIKKVIKTLNCLEVRLKGLLSTYGASYEVLAENIEPIHEEDPLLNGPQEQNVATSQEEIDRILNS